MWLLLLRGASDISVVLEPMESFSWLTYAPKGGETHVQGLSLIHIGGPALTIQGHSSSDLRLRLGSLESVEDYLLPRFIDGNPISKYVTFAVLFVEPSMAT